MTATWLARSTTLRVIYRDRTDHGGPIGGRIEASVRAAFGEALALLEAGRQGNEPEVVAALQSGTCRAEFSELVELDDTGGGWRVRRDVRHPRPELIHPHELVVTTTHGAALDVRVPSGHWPLVHDLVARLNAPTGVARDGAGLHPDMADLLRGLGDLGALSTEPLVADPILSHQPGLTFLGHNAALVRGDRTAVLVDPFLPRPSAGYPQDYQPWACDQLGHVDAILITHGHPDHFDPASLLRFPVATPVIVPVVERESILAPDLGHRVSQLGFTDVRPRAWGTREQVGEITVDVLPFFGEQPTEGVRIHPDVVNAGNAYVVRTAHQRIAFVADAGVDDRGSTADAAARYCNEHGPIDVVFAGYRGWHTTPAELLRSSVGRYFLFVPPDQWDRSMDLMNDASGALRTTTAFGAPVLVPYADGGAPWFWELGLGPRLDETPLERAGFDPFPERVSEAAAAMAGAPEVLLLRPGQRLEPDRTVSERPGHRWPWPPITLADHC